jgi:hypothetical protein
MASMVYQPEFYRREVAFCKVYGSKSKTVIEGILLKNRISYFIQLQKESLILRVFSARKGKDKAIFVFNINEADVEKAIELLKELDQSQVTFIDMS